MRHFVYPFVLAILAAACIGCPKIPVYVSSGASDPSPDGSSWEEAFPTIQQGIDYVASTGTPENYYVWVSMGVYSENRVDEGAGRTTGALVLAPGVEVRGGFIGNEPSTFPFDTYVSNITHNRCPTVIDGSHARNGQPAYHVVIGAEGASLIGFTVTGGQANGDPETDLDKGAGLYNAADSFSAHGCIFRDNEAGLQGGGIYNTGGANVLFASDIFTRNAAIGTSTLMGGAALCNHNGGSATLVNCVIAENSRASAIANLSGAALDLMNCTITRNSAAIEDTTIHNVWSTLTVTNCIIWENKTRDGIYSWGDTASVSASYSDIQYGYPGEGNINEDPWFSNPEGFDFRLRGNSQSAENPNSPCRDTGTEHAFSFDFYLFARPQDDGWDMGAYEGSTLIFYSDTNLGAESPDGLTWETAYATIGESIQAAFDALSAAAPGARAEVWVADGTYDNEGDPEAQLGDPWLNSLRMTPNVHLFGGFSGGEQDRNARNWEVNKTIIKGIREDPFYDAYHTVIGANDATLDGFVVLGGYARDNDGVFPAGGGMYNYQASPVVENCVFESCQALAHSGLSSYFARGGAIYNFDAHPRIAHCTFTANGAVGQPMGENEPCGAAGGAIANDFCFLSYPVIIEDCRFEMNGVSSGNLSSEDVFQYGGGAIFSRASVLDVSRCSFIYNHVGHCSGGSILWLSDPQQPDAGTLRNCTFAFSDVYDEPGQTPQGGGAVLAVGSTSSNQQAIAHPRIVNCTAARAEQPDTVSSVHVRAIAADIVNTIVWHEYGPLPEIAVANGGQVAVTYSCVRTDGDPYPGAGNIADEPTFCDVGADHPSYLRPTVFSRTIDAGTAGFGIPDDDIEGSRRPVGPTADMGAFEAGGFVEIEGGDGWLPIKLTIGDVDGFGWQDGSLLPPGVLSAAGDPVNVDGVNLLRAGDFLGDMDGDENVWWHLPDGQHGGDDWDMRSSEEAVSGVPGHCYVTGYGIESWYGTDGAQFTDISLSHSYDQNLPDPPFPFPSPPSAVGDAQGNRQQGSETNMPTFVFDFYVLDYAPGTIAEARPPLYLNMLFGDYDVGEARVEIELESGWKKILTIQKQNAQDDGLIQAGYVIMNDPKTCHNDITFDGIFYDTLPWIGGRTILRGYLKVTFLDGLNGSNFEPYMTFDFCEFATDQISIGVRHVDSMGIQRAIDDATDGDTIIVDGDYDRPVSYAERIDFRNKSIVVTSNRCPGGTVIIEAPESDPGPVVTFRGGETSYAEISGFVIAGGDNSSGAGGGISGNGTEARIADNEIRDNYAAYGGGVAECASIWRCRIHDNYASVTGGGVYACPEVRRNWVYANGCAMAGGGIAEGTNVVNNIVYDNWIYEPYYGAIGGAGIYMSGEAPGRHIAFCTVVYNTTDGGPANVNILADSTVTISDNIMWGIPNEWNSRSSYFPTAYNCMIQGAPYYAGGVGPCWGSRGGIYNDCPGFANVAQDDYRLQADSGAREAASQLYPVEYDIEGTPRPEESSDVGAYEYREDSD